MPLPALDHLLDPEYIRDLEGLSIEDIRHRRAACQEAETALSYLRRLVQGRLDIVQADLDRRAGGSPSDLSTLIEQLPEILGSEARSGAPGRLPSLLAPHVEPDLTAELDAILPPSRTGTLPEIPDQELRAVAAELGEFEREVSARRRALHEQIDTLQEEIVRRYRTGEASVDSLLK